MRKKHTGICLGFDVNEELAFDVNYLERRLYPGITGESFFDFVGEEEMTSLFTAKQKQWEYEREVRMFVEFEPDALADGPQYMTFGQDILLREVLLGPRYGQELTPLERLDSVTIALGDLADGVTVGATRLSYETFSVVLDDAAS